jgi:hypothetical protein
MTAVILVSTLILICALAPRFGVDSRSRKPSGWLGSADRH